MQVRWNACGGTHRSAVVITTPHMSYKQDTILFVCPLQAACVAVIKIAQSKCVFVLFNEKV